VIFEGEERKKKGIILIFVTFVFVFDFFCSVYWEVEKSGSKMSWLFGSKQEEKAEYKESVYDPKNEELLQGLMKNESFTTRVKIKFERQQIMQRRSVHLETPRRL